ncbi:MAG: tyrosine-protein phosphatase [Bacillota bacterium]
MIDLHAHILPGVDDGPATWAEAIELCRQLASQGVTGVVAAPHFVPGRYPEAGRVLGLVQELNQRLRSISCALTVYPGAEAYLVPELPRLVAARTVPTLNNAGRYLLLELPLEGVPSCAENVLFSLLLDGVTPVLAHPERNAQLREDPSLLATLVERGALVQVNAGSLAGEFGPRVQKLAGDLARQGLVHLMGSDAHCPHKRPPLWPVALPRLEKLAGREAALAITLKNPAAVLAGNEVVFPGPGPVSRRGSNFWGRALAKLLSR